MKMKLEDSERQPCEIWTRVMGYHRPVASFNIGKKGEHSERKFFVEPKARMARFGNGLHDNDGLSGETGGGAVSAGMCMEV